jgi:serine/threonine protein kinase
LVACPHCGGALPPDGPEGLCPACLLRAARASPLPERAGQYDILDELDRGGMGIVYRARDRGLDRLVALKMIRSGEFATAEARSRFLAEVNFVSRFEHPNIVRIYDANVSLDGSPYYTMPWVEGGSLAKHLERFREPRRVARLMATVARAVQFCHDAKPEPVLHRDLKPENILLGPDDHPYLADFGIAKALGRDGGTGSGAIVGTIEYMSPEQASGEPVGPATDVWGLGALTYLLLTGSPPFGTGRLPELLYRIRYEQPTPPRQRVRSIDRDLEKICLRALEKDAKRRYLSAADFADDLERFLRFEPPAPLPEEKWKTAFRWARDHPLASIGITGTFLVLAIAAVSTVWLVRDQSRELLRSAKQVNALLAQAQAGAMLNQLREYADRVQRATVDISKHATYSDAAGLGLPPDLGVYASAFDGMTLFSTEGHALARWPLPVERLAGKSFKFRDYFKGADRLGLARTPATFVAPAYRSEPDGTFEFAFSAPVFDAAGIFRCVLLAMHGTDSTFGPVLINDPQSGRVTVLLGPHGAERDDPVGDPPSGQVFMLVHPSLHHGDAEELPRKYADRLRRSFGASAAPGEQFATVSATPVVEDRYHDKLDTHGQRWLAAFAPVGSTGYVVLVQSRYEDAVRVSRILATRVLRAGLPLGAAVLLLWAVMLRVTRRRLQS